VFDFTHVFIPKPLHTFGRHALGLGWQSRKALLLHGGKCLLRDRMRPAMFAIQAIAI
jgi:hypothetical protein